MRARAARIFSAKLASESLDDEGQAAQNILSPSRPKTAIRIAVPSCGLQPLLEWGHFSIKIK